MYKNNISYDEQHKEDMEKILKLQAEWKEFVNSLPEEERKMTILQFEEKYRKPHNN